MKKVPITNWLAALGIGGSFVLPGEAAAQVSRRDAPRAEVQEKDGLYVVINHEEQYSVWPGRLRPPRGWEPVAPGAPVEETLRRLDERVAKLRFLVVINHEEQYSIWPLEYEVPEGFEPVSRDCALQECAKLMMERPR